MPKDEVKEDKNNVSLLDDVYKYDEEGIQKQHKERPWKKTHNYFQNVKINDYAVLSTNSLILPGVEIGEGCVIGASSKVSESTMKDHLYAGNPAKKICHTSKLRLKNDPSKSAYPWRENYQKGYPEETVKLWNQILE